MSLLSRDRTAAVSRTKNERYEFEFVTGGDSVFEFAVLTETINFLAPLCSMKGLS